MGRLRLLFSAKIARGGRHLDQTLRLIWELEAKGVGRELINTDDWTEEQVRHLYHEAMGGGDAE